MKGRIVQINTCFVSGDGIGGIIQGIHDRAIARGFDSQICGVRTDKAKVAFADPKLERLAGYVDDAKSFPTSFVYHFGVKDDVIDRFFEAREVPNKAFYYHNVTPAHFFKGWNRHLFRILNDTDAVIKSLLKQPWTITGDSQFNIDELPVGSQHAIMPPVFPVSGNVADEISDEALSRKMLGDVPTLLFVGRFAPNKRQDVLLYLLRDLINSGVECRMILAGRGEGAYMDYLRKVVKLLGLERHTHLMLEIPDAETIEALYRFSNYVVIASEHEGFCVPIIESLSYGCVPIARPFCALEELLAGSSALAPDKSYESYFAHVRATLLRTFRSPEAFLAMRGEAQACFDRNTSSYLDIDGFVTKAMADANAGSA